MVKFVGEVSMILKGGDNGKFVKRNREIKD